MDLEVFYVIWLIGQKGMLGQQITLELTKQNTPFVGTDIEVDITDIDQLISFAKGKDIDWIINASAYTAVDKAESEQLIAQKINSTGVGNIAQIADIMGAKVIHFSTDYVFDGTNTKPYLETDLPHPVSAYGRTKLDGEIQLAQNTVRYFIFRISWLYGVYGANFVKTMVRLFNEKPELGIINDQKGSPTYAGTLAKNIVSLASSGSDAYGIYNYSDEGVISWYDFAVEIKGQAAKRGLAPATVKLNAITTDMYPTPAKRPANSAFNKSKVRTLGFELIDWKENLNTYFNELEQI